MLVTHNSVEESGGGGNAHRIRVIPAVQPPPRLRERAVQHAQRADDPPVRRAGGTPLQLHCGRLQERAHAERGRPHPAHALRGEEPAHPRLDARADPACCWHSCVGTVGTAHVGVVRMHNDQCKALGAGVARRQIVTEPSDG